MSDRFKIYGDVQLIPPTNIAQTVSAIQKSIGKIPIPVTFTVDDASIQKLKTKLQSVKFDVQVSGNFADIARQIKSQVNSITQSLQKLNNFVPKATTTATPRQTQNAPRGSSTSTRKKDIADETDAIISFGKASGLALKRFLAFTLAAGPIYAISRALKTGAKDAIDFDREMVRVSQVTGVATQDLTFLSNEITRLATTFGVGSNGLVKVAVTLAQAGLSAKDTKIALEALAKTEISATFGDINKTTEASIAIMQQFKLQAKDLEAVLGRINAVSAAFAVESEDISVAVRRAGGSFAAAGGNIDEFIALFTSVRQTTRESAESIATGLRTIFTRFQRNSTVDFLERMGIQLRDLKGQFVGPYESIRRLSIALKDLPTTDPRFSQLIEELGGFRQVSKVIPLIQQFDVSQKALNISLQGGTSLSKDAEVAQQALAIQIKKVKEEFAALSRTIVNSEGFKIMFDTVIKLTTAIIKLGNALAPLLPALTAIGGIKLGRVLLGSLPEFGRGFGASTTKRNSGGIIPGVGSTDTIPAMLTPGEFVLRKDVVKKVGLDNLMKLNSLKGFNKGGPVGFAGGGPVHNIPVIGANPQQLAVIDLLTQKMKLLGLNIEPLIRKIKFVDKINAVDKDGKIQNPLAVATKDKDIFVSNKVPIKELATTISHEMGHVVDLDKNSNWSSEVLGTSASNAALLKRTELIETHAKTGSATAFPALPHRVITGKIDSKFNQYLLEPTEVFADMFGNGVTTGNLDDIRGVLEEKGLLAKQTPAPVPVPPTPAPPAPPVPPAPPPLPPIPIAPPSPPPAPKPPKRPVNTIVPPVPPIPPRGPIDPNNPDSPGRKPDDPNDPERKRIQRILNERRLGIGNGLPEQGPFKSNRATADPNIAGLGLTGSLALFAVLPAILQKFTDNTKSANESIVKFTESILGAVLQFAVLGPVIKGLTTKRDNARLDKINSVRETSGLKALNSKELREAEGFVESTKKITNPRFGANAFNRKDALELHKLHEEVVSEKDFLRQQQKHSKQFIPAQNKVIAHRESIVNSIQQQISQLDKDPTSRTDPSKQGRRTLLGTDLTKAKTDLKKEQDRLTNVISDIHDTELGILNRGTRISNLRQKKRDFEAVPEAQAKIFQSKEFKDLERSIVLQKEQNAIEKSIKKTERLTNGILALGIAAEAIGDFISDIAEKNSIEGKRESSILGVRTNTTTAGGVGGALQGAARGALLLGTLGALSPIPGAGIVGAGVGAVVGGVSGAIQGSKSTERNLTAFDFNKSIEELNTTLQLVSNKRIGKDLGELTLKGQFQGLSKSLEKSFGKEEFSSLFNTAKGQAPALDGFIQQLASTATTLEEFKTKNKDLILLYTKLTNIPLDTFEESLKQTIKLSAKNREFQKESLRIQEETNRRFSTLVNFINVINESSFSLSRFNERIDFITSLSGEVNLSSPNNDDLFGAVKKGRFKDLSQFNQITDNVALNAPDVGLDAKNAAFAIAKLPGILSNLQIQGDRFSDEDLISGLKTQLSNILPVDGGSSALIRDSIVNAFGDKVRARTKDEGSFLRDLRANPEKEIADLVQGSGLSSTIDRIAEASNLIAKNIKEEQDILAKVRKISKGILDIQEKSIEFAQRRLDFLEQDTRVPLNARLRLDDQRFTNQLGQGFVRNGGPNIELIKAEVQRVQQALINNKVNQDANVGNPIKLLELVNSQDKLITELNRLQDGLRIATEVNNRLAIINNEIARQRKDREVKEGFLAKFGFGTAADKREQVTTLGFVARARRDGIDAVPDTQKARVLGFANEFRDTPNAIFGQKQDTFGNKVNLTGAEFIRKLLQQQFGKIGGVTVKGPEEVEAERKFTETLKRADHANKILEQIEKNTRKRVEDEQAEKAKATKNAIEKQQREDVVQKKEKVSNDVGRTINLRKTIQRFGAEDVKGAKDNLTAFDRVQQLNTQEIDRGAARSSLGRFVVNGELSGKSFFGFESLSKLTNRLRPFNPVEFDRDKTSARSFIDKLGLSEDKVSDLFGKPKNPTELSGAVKRVLDFVNDPNFEKNAREERNLLEKQLKASRFPNTVSPQDRELLQKTQENVNIEELKKREKQLIEQFLQLDKSIKAMGQLTTAIDNMPRIIEGKFNHEVNVKIVGAQVFERLNDLVKTFVTDAVDKALADYNSKLGSDFNV